MRRFKSNLSLCLYEHFKLKLRCILLEKTLVTLIILISWRSTLGKNLFFEACSILLEKTLVKHIILSKESTLGKNLFFDACLTNRLSTKINESK